MNCFRGMACHYHSRLYDYAVRNRNNSSVKTMFLRFHFIVYLGTVLYCSLKLVDFKSMQKLASQFIPKEVSLVNLKASDIKEEINFFSSIKFPNVTSNKKESYLSLLKILTKGFHFLLEFRHKARKEKMKQILHTLLFCAPAIHISFL